VDVITLDETYSQVQVRKRKRMHRKKKRTNAQVGTAVGIVLAYQKLRSAALAVLAEPLLASPAADAADVTALCEL
jgi:hypothetical protein